MYLQATFAALAGMFLLATHIEGAALRRVEEIQQCSSQPHLYWEEKQDFVLRQQYESFLDDWNAEYHRSFKPDTLMPRESLIHTLPQIHDGSVVPCFIYWKWSNSINGYQMSAFNSRELENGQHELTDIVEGTFEVGQFRLQYVHPESQVHKKTTEVHTFDDGNHYIIFFSMFAVEYQHVLIDHLGYLAYLKREFSQDSKVKIIMQDTHKLRQVVTALDPEFIANNIVWFSCKQKPPCVPLIQVTNGGTLSVVTPQSSTRHGAMYNMARHWFLETYEDLNFESNEKTIVYYSRSNSLGARHGRAMDIEQEESIKNAIQHFMRRYNRTEKFVIFDGKLSFNDQVKLFYSATVVIGPHGGGLANVLWMAEKECENRPKVLEFATSPQSPAVQNGTFDVSYHTLYSQLPWVEFHQIFFTPESTRDVTFIDMGQLRRALQNILDPGRVAEIK